MEAQAEERKDGQKTLTGALERIIYFDNGFLIGRISDDDGIYGIQTGVKGNMIAPQVGMSYEFAGEIEHNAKWGNTFVFSSYKTILPTSHHAIQKYLSENCPGVGMGTAYQITKKFGEKSLEIAKTDPGAIATIKRLSMSTALEIQKVLVDHEKKEKIQVEFLRIFDSTRVSKRAQNMIIIDMGAETVVSEVVKNPYMLTKYRGIGFLAADHVATNIGFNKESPYRITAAIKYVFEQAAGGEGHTILNPDDMVERATKLLAMTDNELIWACVSKMVKDGALIADYDADWIQLEDYHKKERTITKRVITILQKPTNPDPEQQTPTQETKGTFEGVASDQASAVGSIILSKIFILTGAPGTGKTHTIKKIIEIFKGSKIALAAPTGKAAARMTELTGRDASTIHRLLGPAMVDGKFIFSHFSGNPLPYDLIIIDEVSMVDVSLMASLLQAVPDNARLVLVGDINQLPPVGPGSVLRDMLDCGFVPSAELTTIKRQNPGKIVVNCHRIKDGKAPQWTNDPEDDFFVIHIERVEDIPEKIVQLLDSGRMQAAFGVNDLMREVQIISPTREKTAASAQELNTVLQKYMNGHNRTDYRFWINDKVIQTRNDYENGIINGDIGYIEEIESKDIWVRFENPYRRVKLSKKSNDLRLAYAVTCHKYQGSEAPVVIFPVHRSFGPRILQRNWLYTAISRAQRACVIVGQPKEVVKTCKRVSQTERMTNLQSMLKDEFERILR